MQKLLNSLVVYNGYPLSTAVALGLHVLLVGFILYLQSAAEADTMDLVQPTIIKALFIDENPQLVNRQNLERQRIEQQRQREAEQERQRQEEAERERQQQETERQLREEAQRQAALREREELERQQAERLRQEEEQRQQSLQEARRRQAEQEELERQRQRELERLQEQASEAAAAAAARNEFELVQSATGLIQQVVQERWSRPPSARNGMRAVLQIRMLPTGELLEVSITSSSGDPAFDRSAENAVYSAAPFSELQSLPIEVFNNNFRSLSLIFEPDDLLN